MKTTVSWGVLSTARIGLQKVIPGMQKGEYCNITGIASRNIEKAKIAAKELGIPKYYASYEELLQDEEIDAVYISLPNHLHVEWIIKSINAGKHVLCEKPVSMNYAEAIYLSEEVKKFPHLKVMEAFMYRFHPQWQKVKELINNGSIGQLKSIHSIFSYYNVNPDDIRNKSDIGGGGLLDIGCYCISLARFIFNSEPERSCGVVEYDPKLKTDRLASGILEFWKESKVSGKGTATFTCSTQMVDNKHAEIYGTQGKIEIDNPFVPDPLKPTKIIHQHKNEITEFVFEPCNQYTLQGDSFSKAILDKTDVPTPLNDAVANMKIIDNIFTSSKNNSWINSSV